MAARSARSPFVRCCISVRRCVRPAGLCAVFLAIGGLVPAPSTAQTSVRGPFAPARPAKAPLAAKKTLTLRCFSGQGRQPLAGVDFEFNGRLSGAWLQQWVHGDAHGVAVFELPADKKIELLWFTARKPKFVPVHYMWDSEYGEPKIPSQVDLHFERGHQIGGVVRDEAGHPISGARLEFNMPLTWPRRRSHVFTAGEAWTDDQGRWNWPEAPADCSGVNIQIRHADYLRQWAQGSRSREMVVTLQRGFAISGRVLGPTGKPVVGARVAFGTEYWSREFQTRTAPDGQFTLRNCKAGRSLVTVQAPGMSPSFQDVEVAKETKPLEFRLEPGRTVKIRVVDAHGKPIAYAGVAVDTWRGQRTLDLRTETDAKGETVWNSAPADGMLCTAYKEGYMSSGTMPVGASDEFQVITLSPELVISGRVTDAATGRPIQSFHIHQGLVFSNSSEIYWQRDEGAAYENGRYRFKMRGRYDGLVLEVIAAGYRPARSRTFKPTEGPQTFDFALEPGKGPTGVVVRPDGTPISGVDVALASADGRVNVSKGYFDRNQNAAEMTKTDARGRFEFAPRDDDKYVVVALSDVGFGEATAEQIAKGARIRLQAWGRLKGRVLMGHQPDTGRMVSFSAQSLSQASRGQYVWGFNYSTRTDQEGRFEFERVMPGPGSVSRIVVTEFGRGSNWHSGWTVPVEIHEGRTTEVQIGGTGRLAIGKVRVQGTPEKPLSWSTNQPVTIAAWDKARNSQAVPVRQYMGNFLASGEFRVPDVPPGDYKLAVRIDDPAVPAAWSGGGPIGEGAREFTIPPVSDADSETPFDLGEITVTLFHTLSRGEFAPDFVAERLDGGAVRLADFRGKLLLLNFWSTWPETSLAEFPNLETVHERFGKNPRFAQLSLACGIAIANARRFIEQQNVVHWSQARVGGLMSRVPRDYTVRNLPATFLIGPDGRVLAKDLKGDELEHAITAALADNKLFAAATTDRPPRFPVVRSAKASEPPRLAAPNTSEPSPRLASPPSVIALCDTDPTYGKDRHHDDHLRLLTASGSELWSLGGLATGQSMGGHGVVIDHARQRIYVAEILTDRITAFNLAGRKLWQIEQIPASTLAIDPQTGNIWTSGGGQIGEGETVVFDPEGREVNEFPYGALDIAYNPHDDSFWLVSTRILKLNRKGDILFQKPIDGWCSASAALNPTDGTIWIAERSHPNLANSKDRLWHLNADGSVRHKIELGDYGISAVACTPKTGEAWITAYNKGIRRVTADGVLGPPLSLEGKNLSISPTTGEIWLANKDALLRLDATGKVLAKSPFAKPCQQSWLEAW